MSTLEKIKALTLKSEDPNSDINALLDAWEVRKAFPAATKMVSYQIGKPPDTPVVSDLSGVLLKAILELEQRLASLESLL